MEIAYWWTHEKPLPKMTVQWHFIDVILQDCNNSNVLAMELLAWKFTKTQ